MASLLLGGIGAAIGSSIGVTIFGMSATSIGWSIGSTLGSMLFGPQGQDIQGPRLNDKSVSASAYGNIRPEIFGTYRAGGEIIWSTDLKEHKHTEEAGKGGGGGSYTTYTYTVSFAVAVSAGPIVGVRKIWLDSKLVYTQAEDATPKELQKSDKMAKRITFYDGSETQTADPTIEAELGSGNAPAYRGTAYMVFEDLDVTKYGNRIPVITVEVVAAGSRGYVETIPSTGNPGIRNSLYLQNGVALCYYYGYTWPGGADALKTFEQRTIGLDGTVLSSTTRIITEEGGIPYYYPLSLSPSAEFALGLVSNDGGGSLYIAWYAGEQLDPMGVIPAVGDFYNYRAGDDRSYNIIWDSNYVFFIYKANEGVLFKFEIIPIPTMFGDMTYIIELVWECQVDERRTGTDPSGGTQTFCIDQATGECYCMIDTYTGTLNAIRRISADGEIVETKFTTVGVGDSFINPMGFDNGLLWMVTGLGKNVQTWDYDTETLLNSMTVRSTSTTDGTSVVDVTGNLMVMLFAGELYTASRAITRSSETLDNVVSQICIAAGVDAADIDVTDLAGDEVLGFMVAQQGQARAVLEQLAAAYFFDCVDTGEQLKFVKRGGAVAVTIADDDLGCYGDSEEPSQLAVATRTQEEELPKALTLLYADYDADYLQGGQHSRRQSVLAGTEATVQAPLALTGTIGKQIVDTLMFAEWQNRHKFTLKTWLKYAKVEPCDVISARGETLRVITRREGVNGLIELDTARELPEIYTNQVGTAAVAGHQAQTIRVEGPTNFRLLDIPCLRDEDYLAYGIYFAAAGMLDDWTGATLLKSTDTGSTWGAIVTSDTAAVIGQCGTALGDFSGGNIFDEFNVLRVTVNGTLESKTWDQVLADANVAVVGDEIIQFRTATLVSTGVYDLSGLLRGRRGTEWAMASHADYEKFVLLNTSSVRWAPLLSTDYNTSRLYGALTFGDNITDVETEYLIYSAQNVKPFAPVLPSAGQDESGNVDLAWVRRVPMDSYWIDGRDAGNNMPDPTYNLYIYADSGYTTLLRSQTGLTSASYTYAIADRTTDANLGDYTYFKVQEVHAGVTGEFLNASLRHNYVAKLDSYMTEALALSPAAAWKFDDTSGTTATDASGNARHGTYTGGYTLSSESLVVAGAGEYSVELNGTSGYVSVPDNAVWEGAFTFICMLHPTAAAFGGVFHHGDITVAGQQGKYCNRNANGTIRFVWFNGSFREVTTTAAAPINEPTFIAVRYDGGTALKITVGTTTESFTMSAAILTSNQTLKIGALENTSAANFFKGRIDDALWFGSSLSDAQIYNLRT